LCNAVYVDDVCHAVIAAVTAPLASGERILISGPAPVTWKAFYGAYQDMLRLDALRPEPASIDPQTMSGQWAAASPGGNTRSNATTCLKKLASRSLGGQTVARLNLWAQYSRSLVLGGKVHRPQGATLALFRSRCHVRIDKAKRLLGYHPRFDLTSGMQRTSPYITGSYGRLARIRAQRQAARSGHGKPDAMPRQTSLIRRS
jgi:nucleoside-diphosphate-sugar epimerase